MDINQSLAANAALALRGALSMFPLHERAAVEACVKKIRAIIEDSPPIGDAGFRAGEMAVAILAAEVNAGLAANG